MRKRTLVTMFTVAALAMLLVLPMAMAQSGGSSGGAGPTASELQNPAPGDWPTYGRTLEMTRYSPLDQINTDNVSQLQIAWSRDLGFSAEAEMSPAEYNGVLYVGGPDRVLALDATNGNLIWTYSTKLNPKAAAYTVGRMRGSPVIYDGKVYANIGDGRTVALDAKTGKEVWSTQVALVQYSGGFSSEPIFADGKIVVGPAGGDQGGVPGRVVALNPENGDVVWTFNLIPKPGQPGFDTWQPPSAAQWGGGAGWTPGAYDPQTNTIVWGVGNANPWWTGSLSGGAGAVRSGDNLYTASHVALNADTGKLEWYHQATPNEEWDADEMNTSTIVSMNIDGQSRRVAIIPLTVGYVLLMDVKTGEFLKAYNVYKEETGLQQTVVTGFKADGTPIINEAARATKAGETVVSCPIRWSSFEPGAYSPKAGLYYRPASPTCGALVAKPLPNDWQPGQNALGDEFGQVPPEHAFNKYNGGVVAVDPATGKVAWHLTLPYSNRAGVAATAGGLVFVASPDRVFRALDAKTGDVLWQQTLTATMESAPITYEVNGTQYVAVPVGGSSTQGVPGAPPTVAGSVAMFVFALPKEASAQ